MIVHPLESAGSRRRSMRSAFPSIALHGALIFLAVRATAHAAIAPVMPTETAVPLYPPRPTASPTQTRPARRSNAAPDGREFQEPRVRVPDLAPDAIPPIPSGRDPAAPSLDDFRQGGLGSPMQGVGLGRGVDGSSVLRGDQVDRQVEPLGAGAEPAYPEALRSRAVAGTVVAEFVVDTTGRVEDGSFRALRSDDPLFTASVRAALVRARFRPAEVAGRRVRQVVQQPFTFVLR